MDPQSKEWEKGTNFAYSYLCSLTWTCFLLVTTFGRLAASLSDLEERALVKNQKIWVQNLVIVLWCTELLVYLCVLFCVCVIKKKKKKEVIKTHHLI